MSRTTTLAVLAAVLFGGSAPPAMAEQLFSCPFGKEPACLDFNDKVVDQNSVCFDSYTCNFAGFICRSEFDQGVDDYNALVRDYNELLNYATALESCIASARTLEQSKRCAG